MSTSAFFTKTLPCLRIFSHKILTGVKCCTLWRLLQPHGTFSLPTFLTAGALSGALAAAATTPLDVVKTRLQTQGMTRAKTSTGELHAAPLKFKVRYTGFFDAAHAVYRADGIPGFFRGMGPRMLQTGPSCALSWCAYESAKRALQGVTLTDKW